MGLETQLSGAQLSGAQFAWNRRASLSVKFPVEQNRKGWEQFSLHFKPFKQAKREDNTISFAFPIVYCITPSFKPNEFILPLGNKYHPNMIQSECQQSKPPVNFTQTKNCLNLNLFRGLPFWVPFRVRVRGCFFQRFWPLNSKPAVNSTQTKLSQSRLISSSLTRLPFSVLYRFQSSSLIKSESWKSISLSSSAIRSL